jgi:hypothetical protein
MQKYVILTRRGCQQGGTIYDFSPGLNPFIQLKRIEIVKPAKVGEITQGI